MPIFRTTFDIVQCGPVLGGIVDAADGGGVDRNTASIDVSADCPLTSGDVADIGLWTDPGLGKFTQFLCAVLCYACSDNLFPAAHNRHDV